MRRLTWAVLSVFLAMGCTALPQAQPAQPPPAHGPSEVRPALPEKPEHAPKLVCGQPVFDFGEMENSQTVEHTFVLKNEGDLTLQITRVKPACGCTVAKISTRTLPPGTEATLSTRLNLRGRKGKQRKSITIESNDPKQPRYLLYLEGMAIAEVQVTPDRVFFGRISPDVEATKVIDVRGREKPLHITGVISTKSEFIPRLETVEEGKHYRVHVSTKPPLDSREHRGFLRIKQDGKPDINVHVSASVIGALAVAPQQIVLGRAAGTNCVTRYVVVRPGRVKDFKVENVEPPDPSIQVEVSPMGAGGGYRIHLTNIVPNDELNGKKLRIRTTAEDMKEILIPFRVIPTKPKPNVS